MSSSLRRVRVLITMCFGAALCALLLAGPAAASSSSPYPPSQPTSTTVCSASSGSCVAGVVAHNGGNNHSDSGSGLAQTGFDSGIALIIVIALVGVGVLCVVAGRRRRHV